MGLGVQSGFVVTVHVLIGFMRKSQFKQQHRNDETIQRPTVVNEKCIIGSEMQKNCNYAIKKISQFNGETISCLRHLAKE